MRACVVFTGLGVFIKSRCQQEPELMHELFFFLGPNEQNVDQSGLC